MPTDKFMAEWGQFSIIEFFNVDFPLHYNDNRIAYIAHAKWVGRAPLWCVRQTGTGYTNPYPRRAVEMLRPEDDDFADIVF